MKRRQKIKSIKSEVVSAEDDDLTLTCKKCGNEKCQSEFYKSSRGNGYRTNKCKECAKAHQKEEYVKQKLTQFCDKCHVVSNKDMSKSDKLKNMCRECQSLRRKQYDGSTKTDKLLKKGVKLSCETCGRSQKYEEFYKDIEYKCGYNIEHCKSCLERIEDKITLYELEERENARIANLIFENTEASLLKCIEMLQTKIKILNQSSSDEDSEEPLPPKVHDPLDENKYIGFQIRMLCKISGIDLSDPWHGYLYIIREREFVKCGDNVFKIGYTNHSNPNNRMCQYPNNSEVIAIEKVYKAETAEKVYMKSLDMLCDSGVLKHRRDIGREYYEGDVNIIREVLHNCIIDDE